MRDAVAAHRSDPEIAAIVREAKLTDRLGDAPIEAIESDGAGPLTLAELDRLRDLTESLPATPWILPGAAPVPSADEQARIIARAREIALQYAAGLPNFLCTATVRRYSGDSARPKDTLVLDVSFTGQRDRYRLVSVNGKQTRQTLETVGGFSSNGEYGTAQRMIFDPKSEAQFVWERWTRLRGRPAQVFAYHVEAAHSQFLLNFERLRKGARMIAGMRGQVYLDPDTHAVLRFRVEAEGIPTDFPVIRTVSVVDYAYAGIGSSSYLLPRASDLRLYRKNGRNRNLMEFTNYRRFTGESTISFDK